MHLSAYQGISLIPSLTQGLWDISQAQLQVECGISSRDAACASCSMTGKEAQFQLIRAYMMPSCTLMLGKGGQICCLACSVSVWHFHLIFLVGPIYQFGMGIFTLWHCILEMCNSF